ncbi:MAG: lipocalin-like domain-containing protein [Prevotella sp.]|jgi:hypothetical protein|nr:lipocalin-like domain-containing protein [Prevotella sp.]
MKKSILLAFLTLFLSACHFEVSDNGDLDGFWQLYSEDTLSSGQSADMRQSGIYWAVQMRLLSIEAKKQNIRFLFRFTHEGSTLRLYDPRVDFRPSFGERADTAVTCADSLHFLGLNSLDESFFVEELNSSRMTLRNDSLRLYFRRY